MSKDQSQTVMTVMNKMEGVTLREKRNGRFKFRMHMTQSISEAPIEILDLSARPYNNLKRSGYKTVGDVVDAISSGIDLSKIRNCGKKSVREILEKLFLLQYNSLPADKRDDYLMEVVLLNMAGKPA